MPKTIESILSRMVPFTKTVESRISAGHTFSRVSGPILKLVEKPLKQIMKCEVNSFLLSWHFPSEISNSIWNAIGVVHFHHFTQNDLEIKCHLNSEVLQYEYLNLVTFINKDNCCLANLQEYSRIHSKRGKKEKFRKCFQEIAPNIYNLKIFRDPLSPNICVC